MIDVGIKNAVSLSGKSNDTKLTSTQIIWNSELVKKWEYEEEYGIPHTLPSPYLDNIIGYRKANLRFNLTEAEEQEFIKCATDIVYFAETYCKTMTDEGIRNITLMPHQRKVLKQLQENRFSVWLSPRQSAKTTTSAFFILWYNLFNYERNSLVIANKEMTAQEVLDKMYITYKNIPFFLKPGLITSNVQTLRFDNGCKIYSSATTPNAGRGLTIHLLYADEFALVPSNIVDDFYKAIYPTLSASKISRMIVTSTAKGLNKFHQIYDAAVKGKNEFFPIRVDWWEIPGRDEAWKRREIANLGSEESFNQEYGNEFLDEEKLLLTFEELKRLNSKRLKYTWRKLSTLENSNINYDKLLWKPDFQITTDENRDKYILSIDTAEGIGGDYSIINIFKLEPMEDVDIKKLKEFTDESDFFMLKQVGVFRDNHTDIFKISSLLNSLVYELLGVDNCLIILEMNRGDSIYLYEKLREVDDYFYEDLIFKSIIFDGEKTKIKNGIILTHESKLKYCRDFRNYLELNKYIITEFNTIEEFNNFGIHKRSFAALTGNDDLVMSCINSAPFFTSSSLSELVSEIYDYIDDNKKKLIDEKLKDITLSKSKINDDIDYSIIKDFI